MAVLDWFCRCGLSGTAVALKPGDEAKRVDLSHRQAVIAKHANDRRPQNRCHGESIRWARRAQCTCTHAPGLHMNTLRARGCRLCACEWTGEGK